MPRLLLPILVGILTSAVQHVVEGFAAATSPSPSLGPSSPSSLTTESFPPWRIPSQCTDMRYYWLSNNRDQFPCYVASAVAQDCANSIQDSSGPLGSLSCPCNTVLYSLVYACGLCTDTQDWLITFGEWANDIDCGGTAYREYPRNLIPFGVIIPFWAYWDLTLDHYFDVERAREAASPPVTTSARSSSPLTTIPTQSSKSPGPDSSVGTNAAGTDPISSKASSGVQTTSPLQTPSTKVTVSTLAPPPATMMSSDLAASDTRTGADVAATREPEPASSATIAGPVIGGVGALTLAAYGLVTVVVCLRQRRRYHVNETAGDSKTPCQNRFSEAEHVTIPRPDKLVEQRSPEAPACQWQPPLSPQQPDYAAAPRMPKVIMSLYDPDNPATYPPPLSVILGQPVAPWAAPGWDDTTECSS